MKKVYLNFTGNLIFLPLIETLNEPLPALLGSIINRLMVLVNILSGKSVK